MGFQVKFNRFTYRRFLLLSLKNCGKFFYVSLKRRHMPSGRSWLALVFFQQPPHRLRAVPISVARLIMIDVTSAAGGRRGGALREPAPTRLMVALLANLDARN